MTTTTKTKQRIAVEFPPETVEILEDLKTKLNKSSVSDVIRLAIQLLAFLEKQRAEGYSVSLILRKDGADGTGVKEKEVVVMGLLQ